MVKNCGKRDIQHKTNQTNLIKGEETLARDIYCKNMKEVLIIGYFY